MKDLLLNTEEKRNKAISRLRRLYDNEDWKFMSDILDANIEVVRDKIIEGAETKEETDLLRERLRVYKDVRDTPSHLIRRLTSEDKQSDEDVYLTADEINEART